MLELLTEVIKKVTLLPEATAICHVNQQIALILTLSNFLILS